MNTTEIVELITGLASFLVPLIAFITALVKVIREKQWNILKSALCDFMIKAEETIDGTGEEKKEAVLKWCKDFCDMQHINFNTEQVSNAIEVLINLSKKVNAKDKTKEQ